MAIPEKKSAVLIATLVLAVLPHVASAQVAAQADPNASTNAKIAMDILRGPITDDEFKIPLDADAAGKVDAALGQLSFPEYKKRENATTALIEIGAPAFGKLREAYLHSDNPEVRQRIERIVRTAYLDYYVLDQFGYLGIQMGEAGTGLPGQRVLPEGGVGIKVNNVLPNTGAARAGLRTEDIVVEIDGVPLAEQGISNISRFGERIRSRRPGTKMKLTVLRAGTKVDVEPVLGRAPVDTAKGRDGMRIEGTSQMAELAENRFEVWWPKYFNPNGATTTTDRTPPRDEPMHAIPPD